MILLSPAATGMTATVATDVVLHRPSGAVHITQGGAGGVLSTPPAVYPPPNLRFSR